MSTQPLSETERAQLVNKHFSRAAKRPGIYLANHSLGRPLDRMAADLQEFADLWYDQMDNAWEPWLNKIAQYQDQIAKLLHHPQPDAVIPKSSVGQSLRAVLNAFPQEKVNVVTTAMEFDSVDFILRTYESQNRVNVQFVPTSLHEGPVPLIDSEDIISAISDETDLVVISHVVFTTGQVIDRIPEIITAAHNHGACVVLDTYHSFGVLPINLQIPGWNNLDFVMGGSYKYVHGGPGACWLAVAPHILADNKLQTRDTGWFAKADLFGYQKNDARATDGRGWWESTPPVVTAYQAVAGLEFLNEVGIPKLRATSLQDQLALRNSFQEKDLPIFQPADPTMFGGFSLLPHDEPKTLVQALKEQKITVDARGKFVRFCPDLLNTPDQFQTVAQTIQQLTKRSPGIIITPGPPP